MVVLNRGQVLTIKEYLVFKDLVRNAKKEVIILYLLKKWWQKCLLNIFILLSCSADLDGKNNTNTTVVECLKEFMSLDMLEVGLTHMQRARARLRKYEILRYS